MAGKIVSGSLRNRVRTVLSANLALTNADVLAELGIGKRSKKRVSASVQISQIRRELLSKAGIDVEADRGRLSNDERDLIARKLEGKRVQSRLQQVHEVSKAA